MMDCPNPSGIPKAASMSINYYARLNEFLFGMLANNINLGCFIKTFIAAQQDRAEWFNRGRHQMPNAS